MNLEINVLTMLLVSTGLLLPVLFVLIRRMRSWNADENLLTAVHYWLNFLFSVSLLRVLAGLLLMLTGIEIFGINNFYPIRIAYPNYGLIQGLPYLLVCLVVLSQIIRIGEFISSNRMQYLLLWIFSILLLISFGAIHGGFISGNIGIANSSEHLADVSLNATVSDIIATHTDRILGLIAPAYQAPHSASHPVGSLMYWHILSNSLTPIMFSIINVLVFSLAFPVMYWALRRRYDAVTAMQSVLACLFIPAMLVYGRADDAVYYAFAAIIIALVSVAIHERRYALTVGVGALFVGAMNFSYAAIVLLPAMFSFSANTQLAKIPQYLIRVIPHIMIVLVILAIALYFEDLQFGYNWLEAFRASVGHNQASNIVAMLGNGHYERVINDRVMAFYDFLIFAGPLLLYLFVHLIKNINSSFGTWKINSFALFVLMSVLLINSNGPGEVSRAWGSLFLLIGFCWLPEFLSQMSKESRWWLIRTQLVWALMLQTLLNFGW